MANVQGTALINTWIGMAEVVQKQVLDGFDMVDPSFGRTGQGNSLDLATLRRSAWFPEVGLNGCLTMLILDLTE
jgi:hypothetical protein